MLGDLAWAVPRGVLTLPWVCLASDLWGGLGMGGILPAYVGVVRRGGAVGGHFGDMAERVGSEVSGRIGRAVPKKCLTAWVEGSRVSAGRRLADRVPAKRQVGGLAAWGVGEVPDGGGFVCGQSRAR